MYQLVLTNQFKKDIKRLQRRAYDMTIIKQAIIDLENNGQLQSAIKPHRLSGNYIGYWEAHLKNDWQLIWKVIEEENEVWLTRTGTHSDLF